MNQQPIISKTLVALLVINYFFLIKMNAQVAINYDGADPDASAMLDIKSTNKGILIPRMTTTQQNNISSPAEGLLVYNTTTNTFWFFDGSTWQEQEVVSNISSIQDNNNNTEVAINTSNVISLNKTGGGSFLLKKNAKDFFILRPSMDRTVIGQNAAINTDNSVFGYNTSNTTFLNMAAFGMNSSMGMNEQLAIGANASLNSVATNSITIGAESGQNFNQYTNYYSTAIGYQAGQNGSYRRTVLGHQAGTDIAEHDFFCIENSNTITPLLFFQEDNLEINGTFNLVDNLTSDIYMNFNDQSSGARIRVSADSTVGMQANGPISGGGLYVRGELSVSGNIIMNGKDNFISSARPLRLVGGKVSSGGGSVTYIGNQSEYISQVKRVSKGYYKIVVDKLSGQSNQNLRPIIVVTAFHDGANDNRYAQIETLEFYSYASKDYWEIFVEIRNNNGNKKDAPFNFLFFQRESGLDYTN